MKPPAYPGGHITSGLLRRAFGGRVDIAKENLARLAARANRPRTKSAFLGLDFAVFYRGFELSSPRGSE